MYLGIEIGGTKLQLGVGLGDGSPFVDFARRTIDIARGAEGILEQIAEAAPPLIARHGVTRLGYGFGGPVRPHLGRVTTSHQVAGWDDFPLIEWTRKTLGIPAALGNDCDVAALAEARFGAGRGEEIVFYVTVGTGVGGGLVIDGRNHGLSRPAVAEIGHLRPGLDAIDPHTTVESLAAGPGIATFVRRELAGKPADHPNVADLIARAGSVDAVTGKHVAEAAAAGNELAVRGFRSATRALGWAIAQVITIVAPSIIVIGGGVSLAGESLFFAPLREEVARYVFPPLAKSYRIVPAALGEEVVVQGALALAAV